MCQTVNAISLTESRAMKAFPILCATLGRKADFDIMCNGTYKSNDSLHFHRQGFTHIVSVSFECKTC